MINNDLLADRLNAYRNDEPIPDNLDAEEYQPEQFEERPILDNLLIQLFNFIIIFVKSLGYGYAAKTVFETDWKFLAFLSVGFTFNMIISLVFNSITNNNHEQM